MASRGSYKVLTNWLRMVARVRPLLCSVTDMPGQNIMIKDYWYPTVRGGIVLKGIIYVTTLRHYSKGGSPDPSPYETQLTLTQCYVDVTPYSTPTAAPTAIAGGRRQEGHVSQRPRQRQRQREGGTEVFLRVVRHMGQPNMGPMMSHAGGVKRPRTPTPF